MPYEEDNGVRTGPIASDVAWWAANCPSNQPGPIANRDDPDGWEAAWIVMDDASRLAHARLVAESVKDRMARAVLHAKPPSIMDECVDEYLSELDRMGAARVTRARAEAAVQSFFFNLVRDSD